jgi:uncharacterized protein YggE
MKKNLSGVIGGGGRRVAAAVAAALWLLAAAGAASATSAVQPPPPRGDREADMNSGILVQGTGEVRVKPDIARISVGVQTEAVDPTEAARQNAERTDRVIRALRAAGIAERDIQTQNYAIYPRYDNRPRPTEGGGGGTSYEQVLVGYQVSNTVSVTVRKIDNAGKALDAAVKAGANVAGGISFDVDDPSPAKDEALRKAVADALRKARVVADAAKAGAVRLVAVVEGSVNVPRPFLDVGAGMKAMSAEAVSTPISPGEQAITAVVTVRFAFVNPPAAAPSE